MNDKIPNNTPEADDMQDEYDFSGGERGKHFQAFQQGYTIHIHKRDGTVQEKRYAPTPRLIELDEDVYAYFPDAATVNRALRALIEIAPRKQ